MRRNPDGSITLSRRNLLTLLSKIDQPESARTLFAARGGIGGVGEAIVVRSESDEVHYADRAPGGPISPESQAYIDEYRYRGQNG